MDAASPKEINIFEITERNSESFFSVMLFVTRASNPEEVQIRVADFLEHFQRLKESHDPAVQKLFILDLDSKFEHPLTGQASPWTLMLITENMPYVEIARAPNYEFWRAPRHTKFNL